MPLKPLIVEDIYVDLADYFGEFNDDPDAVFGEYAKVGPREWDEDSISFTVTGKGNGVRITIAPHPARTKDSVACPECGRDLDHQHTLSERRTCMRALRARQLGIVTESQS